MTYIIQPCQRSKTVDKVEEFGTSVLGFLRQGKMISTIKQRTDRSIPISHVPRGKMKCSILRGSGSLLSSSTLHQTNFNGCQSSQECQNVVYWNNYNSIWPGGSVKCDWWTFPPSTISCSSWSVQVEMNQSLFGLCFCTISRPTVTQNTSP